MPNEYKKRCDQITAKIKKHTQELIDLQAECPHTGHIVTHKGDTGNYDPSKNEFWAVHFCPDCGKRWSTDE